MESEKSKRKASKDSLTDGRLDGKLPDDDVSQSPISKLPVETLIQIFSLLPIRDRVRIQRVSKHWQAVSLKSWLSCKPLSCKVQDWGYKYWLDGGIDRIVIEKVLKLCGPYVTRIDFSEYYDSVVTKLTENNESLFVTIANLCPNLTAVDIRRMKVTAQGLECLAKSYSNLTEFAIDRSYESESTHFSKSLSLLFRNNKNLQRVVLGVSSDGNCLFYLNPIIIKEISIVHGLGGKERICRALWRFTNLRSFSITNWENLGNWDYHRWGTINYKIYNINEMLKAIQPSSESLEELMISSNRFYTDVIDNFKNFGNLRKLVLEGDKLGIVLERVTEYCTKLTCVDLNHILVTDFEMASIMRLPELQELYLWDLNEITDAIFIDYVTSLKILDCAQCSLLTNVGFRSLRENSSEKLESLTITECNVDLDNLGQDAKEATHARSNGPLIQIFVKKDDRFLVQEKKVTKLSEHLELIEFTYA